MLEGRQSNDSIEQVVEQFKINFTKNYKKITN